MKFSARVQRRLVLRVSVRVKTFAFVQCQELAASAKLYTHIISVYVCVYIYIYIYIYIYLLKPSA